MKKETSGNKGEWSEFYALVKLLSDGLVDVSDRESALEIEEKILHSVSKDDTLFNLLNNSEIMCIKNSVSKIINKNEIDIADSAVKLYSCIKNKGCEEKGERGTFSLPFAEKLAAILEVSTEKAKSTSKGDLIIKFSTNSTGSEPKPHDVSIKSWLGANPTLFNASKKSSRLIFEVEGDIAFELLEKFSSKQMSSRKPREGIEKALECGVNFKFSHYFDETFKSNLEQFGVDELIPKIVFAHFVRPIGVATNSTLLREAIRDKAFEHKWKTFLECCALGMTAGKKYDEENNIADNFLVIAPDGQLFCFIGRNRLQNLLYNQAFIDTPSTGDKKHAYGYFYMKDNKIFIDLNFQVRLKSTFGL
jgi:hypothetical protein